MDYPLTLRGGVIVTTPAEHIANYVPYGVDRHEWDTIIGPFVRDVVGRTKFTAPTTVVHSLRAVTQFVVWARENDLPLDAEKLFTPALVDRFIVTGLHITKTSKATYRSSIRRVALAATKKTPWKPPPARFPRAHHKLPYTPAETARWWEIANTQNTASRRRAAEAVVTLGLGVGINSAEHLDVTAAHIRWDDGVLLVDIPGAAARTVACNNDWADRLAQVAAEYPTGPLIGTAHPGRNKNRVNALLKSIETPPSMPNLTAARLRATWIVTHLNNGIRMDELRDALGWKVGHHLHDYFPLLTPRDDRTRHRAMAGLTDE